MRATLASLLAETPTEVAVARAPEPGPGATRLRVLIAEDNRINQEVALLSLTRLGIRGAVVSDGREAIVALGEIDYDIVFMDLQMPGLDGLAATRRIRADASLRQPYIVAMTANATVQDRDACLSAGMNDFVSKPFRVGDLEAVLARYAAPDVDPGATGTARASTVAAAPKSTVGATLATTTSKRCAPVCAAAKPGSSLISTITS